MKQDWHQTALSALILGVEACWLYTLTALLNERAADGRLSVLGLLLLFPVAFGFNRLLSRVAGPRAWLRVISWLAWAVATLMLVKIQLYSNMALSDPDWLLALPRAIAEFYTFRPELIILVCTAVFWWLGQRLAYLRIDFTLSVTEFQFGLIIMFIVLISSSQLDAQIAGAIPAAIAFFSFALVGIFLAHARERKGWLEGMRQGQWFGLLLICIILIVGLGLLVGLLVTADFVELLVAPLQWIWGLAESVVDFFANLVSSDPEAGELPSAYPPGVNMDGAGLGETARSVPMSDSTRNILAAVFLTFAAGCLLLAMWRASSGIFSWLRRMMASKGGAEMEPLPGAFRADLMNLLRRLALKFLGLRRLFRIRRRSVSLPPEVASVRQVYRQLLHWAADNGCPRRTSQTPHEYFHNLRDLLPVAQHDLSLITEQYVSTRYGPSLPTQNELGELKRRWHRVKRIRLKKR